MASNEFWGKVKIGDEQLKRSMGRKLIGVQGSPFELYEIAQIHTELEGEQFSTEEFGASNLTVDIMIRCYFIREHQPTIKMGKGGNIMHVNHRRIAMTLNGKSSDGVLSHADVTVGKLMHAPPQSELKVMGQTPLSAINKTWVFEGSKQGKSAVLVAHAAVRPDSAEVPLHIMNIRDETITIRKGTIIAAMKILPTDLVSQWLVLLNNPQLL